MKRTPTLAVAILVVLVAALSWKVVDGVWTSIQVSFADDQNGAIRRNG